MQGRRCGQGAFGLGAGVVMGCGSSQHALDAYAEENLTLHLDLMYELYGKPTEQVGRQLGQQLGRAWGVWAGCHWQ